MKKELERLKEFYEKQFETRNFTIRLDYWTDNTFRCTIIRTNHKTENIEKIILKRNSLIPEIPSKENTFMC